MTFTDTTYVEAVWYVACAGFDVMGNVYRDAPDQPWRAYYRFRYYNPESKDPFDQKDRKSSYSAVAPDGSDESRQRVLEAFDFLFGMMATQMGTQVQKVIVRGGFDAFQREMSKQPWAHIKMVPVPTSSDAVH